MTRHRTSRIVLLAAIGCMLLALGCGLGIVAVRQGAVAPPDFNLHLGSIRLVGLTSQMPDCHRLLAPSCANLSETGPLRFYTLWLMVQRGQSDPPSITQLISMRIQR
jgi:hypothetical protein